MGENKSDIISRMAKIGREGPPLTPADKLREVMLERAQFQAASAIGSSFGHVLDSIPGMTPEQREQRYRAQIAEYTGLIPVSQRAEAVLTVVDRLARFWKDQLAQHPGDKAYATKIKPYVEELKRIHAAPPKT